MASPGLLFLLLVSSSLFLSTSPASPIQEDLKKVGQKFQKGLALIKDMGIPFLGLIEPQDALISAAANLILGLITNIDQKNEVLDFLKSEFKSLNSKLDEYHAETKWDIWSAAAFHDIEMDIKIAWDKFNNILTGSQSDDEKERLKNEFIEKYNVDSIKTLHKFLTSNDNIFIENLGEMIKEKINCHENEIKMYSFMINSLHFKCTVMNLFYYKKKGITSETDKAAGIAFESSSVMLKIHQYCFLNSMESVKIDVKKFTEKIKNTKKRKEIVHEVRSFLVKSYGSYDWMVVAFKTRNSKHTTLESWNKHVLTGFTEVPVEDITVAVARQAKGNHTMADKVKRDIERCVTKSVECHKVGEKLEACKEVVDKIPVTRTYSAVHAFIDRPHDSHDAKEAPEEIFDNVLDKTVPYFYEGICTKYKVSKKGHFIVLIKSDEDIKTGDPCSKMNCGGDQRGRCVRVKDAFVAMCECNQNFYGLNCEKSLDDYKKDLKKAQTA